tara:strand:- start:6974 stop:7327 length:354 start_codon:yes stop_codon:yes gene_type:complete
MNITRLILDESIDSTISNNDIIYYCAVEALGGFNTQLDETKIKKLGKVLSVHSNVLVVEVTENNPIPSQNDFIFCVKDDEVNLSSLTGYFAEVKMKNTSTEKAELFRLSLGFANSSQ